MAKCGVNIPPGLTITTEVCEEFYRVGEYACALGQEAARLVLCAMGLAYRAYRVWLASGLDCSAGMCQRGRLWPCARLRPKQYACATCQPCAADRLCIKQSDSMLSSQSQYAWTLLWPKHLR